MRLNYKYTIAYSVITFFTLLIGFSIVYTAVKRSTLQTAVGKLRNLNTLVAKQVSHDKTFMPHPQKNVTVQLLNSRINNKTEEIRSKRLWNSELRDTVTNVTLTTTHLAGGKKIAVTSSTYIITADTIYLEGIFMVFAWTFIFLISAVVILSEIFSGYILSPFYSALQAVRNFSIDQKEKIVFEKTSTYEFAELYDFLFKMTENAAKDYTVLKEFSENASHELQTPIAVIKAKMELLMQTNLNEDQLIKLTAMYEELEKLSKINHALTLLTKLENFQGSNDETTDLSRILKQSVAAFSDLAEMKGIKICCEIPDGIAVMINEELCKILFDNLLSNALKHNSGKGFIYINLSQKAFVISNTGMAPTVPTEELFQRFKKNNQSLNSIGIGLAIVRKITEIFHFSIRYSFADELHTVEINFSGQEIPNKYEIV